MAEQLGPRVALASDHAAVELRQHIGRRLAAAGYQVMDLGPDGGSSVDYPEFAAQVCGAIGAGEADWGVLLCGSGQGMAIAANRHAGIRAALVREPWSAQMAREHNDANVVVFGARATGIELVDACLDAFIRTDFTPGDDGRHARRVQKIELD